MTNFANEIESHPGSCRFDSVHAISSQSVHARYFSVGWNAARRFCNCRPIPQLPADSFREIRARVAGLEPRTPRDTSISAIFFQIPAIHICAAVLKEPLPEGADKPRFVRRILRLRCVNRFENINRSQSILMKCSILQL
jgi:hypothetical protein